MFRPTKKRKRPRAVLTTTADNDDDSPDETSVKPLRQSKKQARRPVAMSFTVEEDSAPTKKKKKRKGMGFGGIVLQSEEQQQDEEKEPQGEATLYGKDALNKLKSEQRFKPKEEPTNDTHTDTAAEPLPTEPLPTKEQASEEALPSYIPLREKQPVILTGDEAMQHEENEPIDMHVEEEETEESSAWEAQVASRAGIRASQTRERTSTSTTSIAPATTTSLSKLKEQVSSTISQLELQTEDVQNASLRRQTELTQTQSDLEKQETELQHAGTALEYYQVLREQLASWVGALRELRTKVTPLQEALQKVERLGKNRWTEWQDDVVSVLRQAGLLDRVVGRQPIEEEIPQTTTVDEFGRDVKSQFVLQREKRMKHCRAIRNSRKVQDDDSDVLISDGEQNEAEERRTALRQALQVAMDTVDDEFTSISNLISIFAKWVRSYPEEYKECFASMSLADLASILVQVDLCSTHHPLRSQEYDLPWIQDLQTIPMDESTDEEDLPTYRVVDKVLVPVFVDILDEGAYDICSSKQTRSLSSFYWRICNLFPRENPMTSKVQARVVQYLTAGLDNISIPIVTAIEKDKALSEDVQEAVQYAKYGQVRRVQKFVCNVVEWKINEMAGPVLDFVSSSFLFLLSSLQAQGCDDVASQGFGAIWKALQTTDWLSRPEYMLQAAPIRAAAVVYGVLNE